MGGVLGKGESPKVWMPETKLEAKIKEAMQRRESEGSSMKSFNSIVLKFPKIDEGLRKCKAIFEQFDKDKNGAIDPQELKHCFRELEIAFTDEEITDLFVECDINDDRGMKFNEFIVLLCLVYLLKDDPAALHAKSRMGMPNLEATFETLVDAFVFLDKNKDGYISKSEMIGAINESTGERSSGRIAMKRFGQLSLALSLCVAGGLTPPPLFLLWMENSAPASLMKNLRRTWQSFRKIESGLISEASTGSSINLALI